MTSRAIRVGVIGVGSENSWAREAHVPAIRAVPGLELWAVSARDQERADTVAEEEDATRAYGEAQDLIADPAVDVVVVGVPVPAHADLITQALDAGKHAVTEWPLGVSSVENDALAASVQTHETFGVVGLQARFAPATVAARRTIADGDLGRILSVSVVSTTAGWGPVVPAAAEYLEDPANHMHLLTIQTAHTLDLAESLVGPLTETTPMGSIQFPEVRVDGTDRVLERRVPDHVAIQGRLAGGVPLVVEMRAGCPMDDTPFSLLVRGTDGELRVDGGSPRGFQASALTLTRGGETVALDDPYAELPAPVRNVAGLYTALRDDLESGSRTAPSFDQAARLGHLVDDLQRGIDERGLT